MSLLETKSATQSSLRPQQVHVRLHTPGIENAASVSTARWPRSWRRSLLNDDMATHPGDGPEGFRLTVRDREQSQCDSAAPLTSLLFKAWRLLTTIRRQRPSAGRLTRVHVLSASRHKTMGVGVHGPRFLDGGGRPTIAVQWRQPRLADGDNGGAVLGCDAAV
ncbi:uncharacterized protein A4U43_C08F3710 [Asparagus officinalis]|nr:uncharacterized protein A4U43_C08F3710 [Asparagus officinalis]